MILEMMREMGFCSGIENYSRHLTLRPPGSTPYTLLDYFPEDFLLLSMNHMLHYRKFEECLMVTKRENRFLLIMVFVCLLLWIIDH